jgi:hypothetical protein
MPLAELKTSTALDVQLTEYQDRYDEPALREGSAEGIDPFNISSVTAVG